jgi:hypothetical protein
MGGCSPLDLRDISIDTRLERTIEVDKYVGTGRDPRTRATSPRGIDSRLKSFSTHDTDLLNRNLIPSHSRRPLPTLHTAI